MCRWALSSSGTATGNGDPLRRVVGDRRADPPQFGQFAAAVLGADRAQPRLPRLARRARGRLGHQRRQRQRAGPVPLREVRAPVRGDAGHHVGQAWIGQGSGEAPDRRWRPCPSMRSHSSTIRRACCLGHPVLLPARDAQCRRRRRRGSPPARPRSCRAADRCACSQPQPLAPEPGDEPVDAVDGAGQHVQAPGELVVGPPVFRWNERFGVVAAQVHERAHGIGKPLARPCSRRGVRPRAGRAPAPSSPGSPRWTRGPTASTRNSRRWRSPR